MSRYRYGRSRGLSTAERLSDAQVEALRILRTRADDGETERSKWVRSSNRNMASCVAGNSADVLVELGLARRSVSAALSWDYRITDVGRTILAGREHLDAVERALGR